MGIGKESTRIWQEVLEWIYLSSSHLAEREEFGGENHLTSPASLSLGLASRLPFPNQPSGLMGSPEGQTCLMCTEPLLCVRLHARCHMQSLQKLTFHPHFTD